jgi:RNA polymerase sigma-70 factor, ECF subfamily
VPATNSNEKWGRTELFEGRTRSLDVDLDAVLQRCREGDQLAWEALVRSNQGKVYGIACHYLGNPEEARDVAQEIFVRIFRNLSPEVTAERFAPWMIRIARNACIDTIRRRKARPRAEYFQEEAIQNLSDGHANPEEQWAAESRKSFIYRAMQQLSLLNREIILLKDIFGLSLEEIAIQLKIPIGTAKSRSNRARLELAQKLAPLYRPQWNADGGEE